MMRIGQGFDVHIFGEGDHVMLGGVRVPHTHGVVAHSDGDVVIYALCDAIYGALADETLAHPEALEMAIPASICVRGEQFQPRSAFPGRLGIDEINHTILRIDQWSKLR